MLKMGFVKSSWLLLLLWVIFSCFKIQQCNGSLVSVKFLKTPHAISRFNSAKFVFQALVSGTSTCSGCSVSCKIDDHNALDCGRGKVFYSGLQDGPHMFQVCANGTAGFGCSSYNWTVDTAAPTAAVFAWMPFTSALNVSVNISFTEPCYGGTGFSCSSVNACNLLVYGAGEVIPSSLTVLEPYLRYSLLVRLSPAVQFGRLVLVMDKSFCSDSAGNMFTRTPNSSFFIHYDRRNVFVNLRTHVPEKLLELNNQTRTVQATNNSEKLKVYLYFSEPVLNSSTEILSSLNATQGQLVPILGETLGNRRFGFLVVNMSRTAIVTLTVDSNAILSRQGTSVSPIAPVTFLYDTDRPLVKLNTTSGWKTREQSISVSIKFLKPVFGFNSSHVLVSGGHLQSFQEISKSIYIANVQATTDRVSIKIPENITEDVSGNKNLASDVLEVRHYSVPIISHVASSVSTAVFLVTSFVAGLLTVSTACLQSLGKFSRHSPALTSEPTRYLFRTASHIQVFALSRWLPVMLPVEYYEFVRSLQWIIPYFPLPWEANNRELVMVASSPTVGSHSFISETKHSLDKNLSKVAPVFGLPLTAMEYKVFFETLELKPLAEYVFDPQHLNEWRDFERIMFWLAIIGGSLVLLHTFIYLILKLRNTNSKLNYGALTFPRFELFLIILALPSICKAARSLIKDFFKKGGQAGPQVIVGILLLCLVVLLLLGLLVFLSIGITLGKLLQYKEIHQEGQKFHWYQELIRVTLGPGKRGQWTWRKQSNSKYLTVLGPLFEDLRGPPKYMLSQISGSNPLRQQDDRIIASDDETEDSEAPCIQKLFGILRIYYTFLETVKRVSLGILAGAFSGNELSRTPVIVMLCITSFQLFFLVLKKPFIKKKVQLAEIISVSCQVGIFTTCLVLLERKFSERGESSIGTFMIILFLIGFLAQMMNDWYALYKQTKRLDQSNRSFLTGSKMATFGLISLILPGKFGNKFPANLGDETPTENVNGFDIKYRSSERRSSGSSDKPWHRQLREMAKASFSRDGTGNSNDPSSSYTRWSGFWKRSGSSSKNSSSDSKKKPSGLYKDLEAIFASK